MASGDEDNLNIITPMPESSLSYFRDYNSIKPFLNNFMDFQFPSLQQNFSIFLTLKSTPGWFFSLVQIMMTLNIPAFLFVIYKESFLPVPISEKSPLWSNPTYQTCVDSSEDGTTCLNLIGVLLHDEWHPMMSLYLLRRITTILIAILLTASVASLWAISFTNVLSPSFTYVESLAEKNATTKEWFGRWKAHINMIEKSPIKQNEQELLSILGKYFENLSAKSNVFIPMRVGTSISYSASQIFYLTAGFAYLLFYFRYKFNCFEYSASSVGNTAEGEAIGCSNTEYQLLHFTVDPYLLFVISTFVWILKGNIWIGYYWLIYITDFIIILGIEHFIFHNPAVHKLALTSIFCTFFLVDIHIRNIMKYFTNINLRLALAEVKRMEEENRKNEMRNMIANVAHDMKTPLASFVTGIDFIQHVMDDLQTSIDEMRSHHSGVAGISVDDVLSNCIESVQSIGGCLSNIRNTNSFMLMTINRCIDYTKASKGVHLSPRCETVVLEEALGLPLQCMQNIQQRVEIKVQDLSIDHASGQSICSHIITDKQWLQENLLCLLSNAVKYTSEGEVKVSMSLIEDHEVPRSQLGSKMVSSDDDDDEAKVKETTPMLLFEIEDCGIGIPEDAASHLFQPFRQLQRMTGGTGLGLFSLAKRIEALNGRYGAKNRSDGVRGSIFWFAIPYRPDEVSAKVANLNVNIRLGSQSNSRQSSPFESDHHAPSPLSSPTFSKKTPSNKSSKSSKGSKDNARKLHILVVDDSPAIIKLTRMLLNRLGHRVSTAENGLVATNMITKLWEKEHQQYDVILMDLQMPVMDGFEAVKRIRQFEQEQVEKEISGDMPPFHHQFIIAMSANSDNQTADDSLEMGADTFMGKPFNVQAFNDTITSLLI